MDAEWFVWVRETTAGRVFLLLLGLVLGSFANVVIYRLPRGRSLIFPGSRCPSCGSRIAPWENIPVLSYIALRGRCRHCGAPIPIRYPFVEAAGAVLALFAAKAADTPAEAIASFTFCLLLLVLLFIDLDHRLLPDVLTLPGLAAGLLWSALWGKGLAASVVGAVVGGGSLLLFALGYKAATGREGMGMGDVKMMSMVGAFLGWRGAVLTVVAGSLAGSIAAAVLLSAGRARRHTALPFGVFLAPGAWLALFAGDAIWAWYLGLVRLA